MITPSRSSIRRRLTTTCFTAATALLACQSATAADVTFLHPSAAAPTFARPIGSSSTPRFDEYRLTRLAPDALLSSKGHVKAELPWAVTMPDLTFTLLFGGSKANVARVLHAEKMKARQVRRLHDMIDLTEASNPAQAKAWRTEMQRAMVAAR